MTEPIKETLKEVVDIVKKGGDGNEGFQAMDLREIQDLINTTPE